MGKHLLIWSIMLGHGKVCIAVGFEQLIILKLFSPQTYEIHWYPMYFTNKERQDEVLRIKKKIN